MSDLTAKTALVTGGSRGQDVRRLVGPLAAAGSRSFVVKSGRPRPGRHRSMENPANLRGHQHTSEPRAV